MRPSLSFCLFLFLLLLLFLFLLFLFLFWLFLFWCRGSHAPGVRAVLSRR